MAAPSSTVNNREPLPDWMRGIQEYSEKMQRMDFNHSEAHANILLLRDSAGNPKAHPYQVHKLVRAYFDSPECALKYHGPQTYLKSLIEPKDDQPVRENQPLHEVVLRGQRFNSSNEFLNHHLPRTDRSTQASARNCNLLNLAANRDTSILPLLESESSSRRPSSPSDANLSSSTTSISTSSRPSTDSKNDEDATPSVSGSELPEDDNVSRASGQDDDTESTIVVDGVDNEYRLPPSINLESFANLDLSQINSRTFADFITKNPYDEDVFGGLFTAIKGNHLDEIKSKIDELKKKHRNKLAIQADINHRLQRLQQLRGPNGFNGEVDAAYKDMNSKKDIRDGLKNKLNGKMDKSISEGPLARYTAAETAYQAAKKKHKVLEHERVSNAGFTFDGSKKRISPQSQVASLTTRLEKTKADIRKLNERINFLNMFVEDKAPLASLKKAAKIKA